MPRLVVPWADVEIAVSIPVASMALVVVDDAVGHVLHMQNV
jgi:hypothetical protein